MNKTDIKKLLLESVSAFLSLIPAFVLVFIWPAILFSLWATGLIILFFRKRQNPSIVESKKHQLIEKFLYFQIITVSFAFFFLPVLNLMVFLLPIIFIGLAINKKRRADAIFIKWAKYAGFHFLNFGLLLILTYFFPDIGAEEGLISLALITLVNSIYAVIYLKLESRIPRQKKGLALLIIFVIIVSMTMNMFPQAGDASLFQQLFGGS